MQPGLTEKLHNGSGFALEPWAKAQTKNHDEKSWWKIGHIMKRKRIFSILKVVYPNGENRYYLIKLYGVGLITNPQ